MIEYIRGILDELTPTQATIEAHGVGYILNISLNTYTALQGKSEARLFVYESIREDAWTLYGFATKQERELFLMLISVSGVGGNTARTMLSSFSAPELAGLIMDGNERMLKTVKGLGAKTAQRIIVELRDKVVSLGIEAVSPSGENAAPSLQKTRPAKPSRCSDSHQLLWPRPSRQSSRTSPRLPSRRSSNSPSRCCNTTSSPIFIRNRHEETSPFVHHGTPDTECL